MEIILTIFYFAIFCLIIRKLKFFNFTSIPKYWFIIIFGIKVICSVLLTSVYTHYYPDRSTADIFKYFDDSKVMFDALKSNPIDYFKMLFGLDFDYAYFKENYYHNMGYWTRPYSADLFPDSRIIIRFNAFVRLFSFGHFGVHNVFKNFISLVGLTLVFKAYKSYLVNKEKALFYVIFLIPSVLFWGSGVLKESVIFLALGLLLLNFFKLMAKFKVIYILLILLGILLIIYTKFYLLIAFSIPIGGYFINNWLKIKRIKYGYLLASILLLISIDILPIINDKLDFIYQITTKQQMFSSYIKVVSANSGFLLPELTNGFSIIKNIPNALVNTLIRPFFWECNSAFVWLSAIENTFIIACIFITLYYREIVTNSKKNILYFNLIFVGCLFALIGLTTPVFGSIVRYKIPGLILLLISLLIIIDIQKLKKKHTFLNKIL